MKPVFTYRPYRALWLWGWTIYAVMTFGWWVLLPVFAVQADLTLRNR